MSTRPRRQMVDERDRNDSAVRITSIFRGFQATAAVWVIAIIVLNAVTVSQR